MANIPFHTFRITASPWARPPQMEATPYPPPLRLSSKARVMTSRPALAPTGCPMAMAPPFTFVFSWKPATGRFAPCKDLRRDKRHGGEGLIDLDEVHLFKRQPGSFQSLLYRSRPG